MTIKDGKYPNKKDLEPKVVHPNGEVLPSRELPLADPSDSNSTDVFRKNAHDKTGEHKPSAYSENKKEASSSYNNPKPGERFPYGDQEQYNREFNHQAHNEWNEQKVKGNLKSKNA
ncbi:hypothetical protein [Sporosarcina limicola]|uniref:Uncharacterized protein n=1 Tax=Sporosarcina limicola TaxID=34101 RepID=A0A927MJW7_9BACL|nr:hypothetical protein [Sporosarcina limicola]MBE1555283.1 hypothetical protein [Sporosarcina limicola]